MRNKIGFVVISLFFNVSLAQSADVLVKIDDLEITEQMVMDDINANPEIRKKHLLGHSKQLNEYIDIFYREKLFEHLALKEKLDQSSTYKGLLKAAKRRLLVNLLSEEKKNNIVVPDLSVSAKEFYQVNKEQFKVNEQIEARHILLTSKQDNPEKEAVKKRLTDILQEIKKDSDQFEALAKKYSEDKGSASKGGHLGKFSKGQMVAEFEQQAFGLNESGQLSDVFSTKFGYHIIQLIKRHPAHIAPFEQVKDLIIKKLRKDYIEAEYIHWRNMVVNPEKAQINQEKLQKFVQKMVKKGSLKK